MTYVTDGDIYDLTSGMGGCDAAVKWYRLRYFRNRQCSGIIRSGAVFRSEGTPLNQKDLCHFQLEVKDVCWKHRRSFGFKGQPHKSFRSKGLARVPSMKSI